MARHPSLCSFDAITMLDAIVIGLLHPTVVVFAIITTKNISNGDEATINMVTNAIENGKKRGTNARSCMINNNSHQRTLRRKINTIVAVFGLSLCSHNLLALLSLISQHLILALTKADQTSLNRQALQRNQN